MEKHSLKTIAKKLGISVATVSKALNDYNDISAVTKQRVKDLAQELNFIPDSVAKSLRAKQSKIIGFIAPDLMHHFYFNVLSGVLKVAQEKGYFVVVASSEDVMDNEIRHLRSFENKRVDGILLALSDNTLEYSHVNRVVQNEIPLVLYDKVSKTVKCSKVVINDRKAAQLATQHLIDLGCKKIAEVRGYFNALTAIDRFIGYKNALRENGMTYNRKIVFDGNGPSINDGMQVADRIFEQKNEIDGVICHNDLLAIGIIIRLNELGVKIPEEIAILGFSDSPYTKISQPSLTTVKQNGHEIGLKACEILIEEIEAKVNKKSFKTKTIEIPIELIIRKSTHKPIN
ncbi:LacI family DNA-binding transcriptional regulator [Namhaeicola litoreus]|uniref:LacI family DNA-binding transcriptional regulator n=1 Tax=Namhaeicola litoreus TaxID=1052145 RepID=A0ABW3XYR2_9FLAO